MTDGRDDQDLLSGYADVWWQAIDDFTRLLESLDPEDWDRPTDLAGWDVRAVASHVAHLERVRAVYARRHPDRVARAAALRLESELFTTPSQAERSRKLLEQALTFDPLSVELHRQFWSRPPQQQH